MGWLVYATKHINLSFAEGQRRMVRLAGHDDLIKLRIVPQGSEHGITSNENIASPTLQGRTWSSYDFVYNRFVLRWGRRISVLKSQTLVIQ